MQNKKVSPWFTIMIIVLAIIVLAMAVSIYFRFILKADIFSSSGSNSTTVPQAVCKLDGLKYDATIANRHPLAIMIENHPDARPQSGLDKASIVYEAITEGGITRFMAVYAPQDADKVGPVRSARTYFIDWLSEFNAYYGHVGGNLDALDKIKTDQIFDLDQFGLGETAYWRVPQGGKAIEHTMYTSTKLLYTQAAKKGWSSNSNFTSLNFRKPSPANSMVQNISIDFSTPSYKVDWQYDSQTDTYLRSLAGIPHKDAVTGSRLAAANLIIQNVDRWNAPTTIGEDGWAMQTIGSGSALIFIEGKEIKATWKKTGLNSRTIFYDETGREISFIPGTFWYEITPPDVFKTIKIS